MIVMRVQIASNNDIGLRINFKPSIDQATENLGVFYADRLASGVRGT